MYTNQPCIRTRTDLVYAHEPTLYTYTNRPCYTTTTTTTNTIPYQSRNFFPPTSPIYDITRHDIRHEGEPPGGAPGGGARGGGGGVGLGTRPSGGEPNIDIRKP